MKRTRLMGVLSLLVAVVGLLSLSSCATPYNIAYFQDMPIGKKVKIIKPTQIVFQPADEISILVSTRDASLSSIFSLYNTYRIGEDSGSSSGSTTPSNYIIGSDGCIDFPILGRIKAAGYTREELQNAIKNLVIERDLVKECVVTIGYVNLNVKVMGAVGVGRVAIDRDQFTLLDAIAQSGDLNIDGMRENVKVIRTTGPSTRVAFEVNLCSAEDLYNSPAYYLQQNDIIYVEPNNKTKRTSTEYGSRMVNYTFWTGLLSSALTLIAVFK